MAVNTFEYGDSFPVGNELFWYSPDLGIPPTKLNIDDKRSKLSIIGKEFLIEADLSDKKWITKRLK